MEELSLSELGGRLGTAVRYGRDEEAKVLRQQIVAWKIERFVRRQLAAVELTADQANRICNVLAGRA